MPLDPRLKLRPGLPSDVPAMVDMVLDAFSGNMVGQTFFPRHSAVFWWGVSPCDHGAGGEERRGRIVDGDGR